MVGLARPSTSCFVERGVADVDARHKGEHDGVRLPSTESQRSSTLTTPGAARTALAICWLIGNLPGSSISTSWAPS
ncbi:hypothetical protein [Bosea thiooxidans]